MSGHPFGVATKRRSNTGRKAREIVAVTVLERVTYIPVLEKEVISILYFYDLKFVPCPPPEKSGGGDELRLEIGKHRRTLTQKKSGVPELKVVKVQ